ncbi:MAG: hypothetical protein OXO49_01990 [Gammaproteobacteria bacterium]|nr:hypothetical protein [Gammaproteobacteria bacterium]MDE0251275.1 hypothetical protein [Gammaproteobacteria bacterium]MDE0402040.1 hypothetical protein [Gammaproteobacteria bacterium]
MEDPDRNPDVIDLTAALFSILRKQPEFASVIFDSDNSESRQLTGVGCRSHTMVMTDVRISMFAASMSDQKRDLKQTGLSSNQLEIRIGLVDNWELGSVGRPFKLHHFES